MSETITISSIDGTVTLSPSARVVRTVDTTKGYDIIDRPNQVAPTFKDRSMVREIYTIFTHFKGRRADYDKLFNDMIANRTQDAVLTLTIGRKTGADEVITCIAHPSAQHDREAGKDEFDGVNISLLKVSEDV